MNSDFVEVCVLGKAVGLKGSVKLHNKSDFVGQFRPNAVFYDKNGKEFTIKSFNRQNFTAIFRGFESVEEAKNLTNITLFKTIAQTRAENKLSKGEFFYFDIIGLEIFENEKRLGVVSDILEVGAGFLFEIKTDENLVKCGLSNRFFVPYLDNFIVKIDTKNKKIIAKNALEILENS